MTRRAMIWTGMALAVLTAVWFGAPKVLRRLSFFRIHQVDVVGTRYLTAEEVVKRLGLPADASIFDPLDKARAVVASLPGTIASAASVERHFPGTLRVRITETDPVALAAVNDQLVPLDSHGHALPFDPVHRPSSLPIAEPDSMTAALLSRLREIDRAGYDLVLSARPDHGDIVLDLGEQVIRVKPNADDEVLSSLALVRTFLADSGRRWSVMDARYNGRIFVTRAGK